MKNKWFPLPRYIFRKKNILRELKRLEVKGEFVDIGCGAGDLACSIATSTGMKGYGYDFSKDAIDQAKVIRENKFHLNDKQVEFLQNKSEELSDIKKNKFNLVVCTEVLEHIEDDKSFFMNLVNLASEYLVFSVPAKKSLYSYSDDLAGHFRRYERTDIYELANNSNLEILKIINYGYPVTNIIRLFRELFAKQALSKDKNTKKERTKQSGIHIFSILKIFSAIPLEKILLPLVYFSYLFNRFDLSEGILVIAKKNE